MDCEVGGGGLECVAASYEGGASLGRLEEVAIARCRIAPLVARLLQYRTRLGCRAVSRYQGEKYCQVR